LFVTYIVDIEASKLTINFLLMKKIAAVFLLLCAFAVEGQVVLDFGAGRLGGWSRHPDEPTPRVNGHRVVGAYDVVISEVMADPKPPVSLPESEYLELYNTTSYEVDLTGWELTFSGESMVLGKVTVPSRSRLIICPARYAGDFSTYGPVYGAKPMPAINNGGEWMMLKDDQGGVICFVDYSDDWYEDDYKRDGGWSLEQVDPFNPCGGRDNWKASRAPEGGTPGMANSVAGDNPDWQKPRLVYAGMPDTCSLTLHFNEPLDARKATRKHQYWLQAMGAPDSVGMIQPGMEAVRLFFSQPWEAGIRYRLALGDSLEDCAGNLLAGPAALELERPSPPAPGDWIINEVLFNPWPGGSDYVELYNASDRFMDLGDLILRGGSSDNQRTVNVSTTSRLVPPHTYIVLTENTAMVEQQYLASYPDRLVEVPDLPHLPDKEGEVVLMDRRMQVTDHMKYHEKMHFPLLSNTEGVALERIHFGGSSADPSMWHSASQPSGYGTPTYKNSQFTSYRDKPAPFSITPDVFSPDNDGHEDLLNIRYRFSQPGHVVTIRIFDDRGRLIRLLVNNQAVGTEGVFVWDGFDEERRKVRMGIYVVDAEVYRLSGTVKHYRFPCVAGGML